LKKKPKWCQGDYKILVYADSPTREGADLRPNEVFEELGKTEDDQKEFMVTQRFHSVFQHVNVHEALGNKESLIMVQVVLFTMNSAFLHLGC
jgi:hypothetical protein